MMFKKAERSQSKLRMAITGPSGAGKTKTALRVALGLGKKIAVIDSENGSASKYVGDSTEAGNVIEFDALDVSSDTHPREYVKAIRGAEAGGYDVVVIDSVTHAWESTKSEVDKIKMASRAQNGFTAWAEGSKMWKELEAAIMASGIHVIVTMRSKTEYAQEKDEKGKTVVRKLGMAPEVRDGSEYAFDVVLDVDHDHVGRISKTRCSALDGYCQVKPGEELGSTLKDWLSKGVQPPPPKSAGSKPLYISRGKAMELADRATAAGFSLDRIEGAIGTDPDCVTPMQAKALFALVEAEEVAYAERMAGSQNADAARDESTAANGELF